MNFLALFALKDKLRENVADSVAKANKGKLKMVLVSGDHMETAKYFAKEAGILGEREMNDPGICMLAEDFRREVGKV